MTIYTSYFANKNLIKLTDYAKVRISIGNPRWKLPYELAGKIPELMPTRDMLSMWKEDYQEKYFRILDGVGIDKIKLQLKPFGSKIILLCFENISKDDAWCHRRMFADWWHIKTGKKIPELT